MISIVLPNLRGGGAERTLLYLANHWTNQGMDIEFCLMKEEGELIQLLDPRIKIFNLNQNRIRSSILPLASYFRHQKPHIVLVGLWPLTSAAIVAWLMTGNKSKLFTTDQTHLSVAGIQELKLSPLYIRSLIKATYPFATGLTTVSEGVKKDLCKLGFLPKSSVKVINNPAISNKKDPAPLSEDEVRILWGGNYEHRIIGIGSFKAQKNFPLLIKAFSCISCLANSKLIILGEGALRPELEILVDKLNIKENVSLPGFKIDISPWLKSASLFVLSSGWEGLPTVVIEALEYGVPVVSTDCPSGPAEILENGRYGRLVPVGDAAALAAAIQASLLESHDQDALRRRAQDFAVPRIADQYLAYFRSMGAQL